MRDRSELRALQAMNFGLKEEYSRELIHRAVEFAKGAGLRPCVSISGLDSCVTLHLVRKLYPNTPCIFVNTGMEFPEIIKNAKLLGAIIVLPRKRFHEVVKECGFPVVSKRVCQYVHEVQVTRSPYLRVLRLTGRRKDGTYSELAKISEKWKKLIDAPFPVSEKCCYWLKKEPIKRATKELKLFNFTGVTAEESSNRAMGWVKYGCNIFDGKNPVSRPIMVWTHQDVLRYAIENNVQIPSLYGQIVEVDGKLRTTGYQRTGCYGCGFGAHMDKYPNRFILLERTHPKLHKYVMDKCGMRVVLNFCGIETEMRQLKLF